MLVVDDDAVLAEVTADLLVQHGVSAIWENSPARVVARVQVERPRLVLLDVMMPGMTAPEVVSYLMEAPYHPPVLLYTALANLTLTSLGVAASEFLALMARQGVVGAVPKGIDAPQLVEAVHAALNGQPLPFPSQSLHPPGGSNPV